MTTFHMKVSLNNSAFENPDELPILVRNVSRSLVGTETSRPLAGHRGRVQDSNGNTVGEWWIDHSDEPGETVVTSVPHKDGLDGARFRPF